MTVPGTSLPHRAVPELQTLAAVAEPLTGLRARRRFHAPWERDAEVVDLAERIAEERANVVVVGEAGIGKTAVIAAAARRLERSGWNADTGEQDSVIKVEPFWLVSAARLVAGMRYLGEWEERCEAIIDELGTIGGVLVVDKLLDLARTGGTGPTTSIASFFMPYLQRGELRLVAEATPTELDACRRLLPGLVELFQILPLPPLERPRALSALAKVTGALERDLRMEADRSVPGLAYRMFSRFLPYQALPGPAAGFLTRLFQEQRRGGERQVTSDDVTQRFVHLTGLPEFLVRDHEPLTRPAVFEFFRARIFGQDAACAAVTDLVMRFKAGLNDPQRPIGVLLFCGPTGVGKTELAKTLAEYLFGHGEHVPRLVRLDMSEYAGWDATNRLLVGTDGAPSEFLKQVRQRPFSVVLLDEIEKAAPESFDLLLNALDEGRLTDRFGRVTWFRSSIIILTSNLGAQFAEPLGFSRESRNAYDAEAQTFFRPEFYNRLDAVVTFNRLTPELIAAIASKELRDLTRRDGLCVSGWRLSWTPQVVELLVAQGFDQRYGARHMQRTVETLVVAPLAKRVAAQPPPAGAELRLDCDGAGNLLVTVL